MATMAIHSAAEYDKWLTMIRDLQVEVLRRVCLQGRGQDALRAIAGTSKANHALIQSLPLRKLHMLTRVHVDDSAVIPELHPWNMHTITYISFASVLFRERDANLLQRIPNLRRLNLTDNTFENEKTLNGLLTPVASMLTRLELKGNGYRSRNDVFKISLKVIALMQRLEYVDVYDLLMNEMLAKALTKAAGPTLKTIRMRVIAESPSAALVTACPGLEHLSLDAIISDASIRNYRRGHHHLDNFVSLYPFPRLSGLLRLRSLELGDCRMIRAEDLQTFTALTSLRMTVDDFGSSSHLIEWDPVEDDQYPLPPLESIDIKVYCSRPYHASIGAFLKRVAPGLSSCRLVCHNRIASRSVRFLNAATELDSLTYDVSNDDEDIVHFACLSRLRSLSFETSSSSSRHLDLVGRTCTRLVDLSVQFRMRYAMPSHEMESQVWSRLETFSAKLVFGTYDAELTYDNVEDYVPRTGRSDDGYICHLMPWLRRMTSLKKVHLDLRREVMTKFNDVTELFDALPSTLEHLTVDVFVTRTERADEFAALIVAKLRSLREVTIYGKMNKGAPESFERVLRAGMPFLIVENVRVNVS
jgi:hypothetical protein